MTKPSYFVRCGQMELSLHGALLKKDQNKYENKFLDVDNVVLCQHEKSQLKIYYIQGYIELTKSEI
jgi:hypothetical protein